MGFLTFLLMAGLTYLVWRISDLLPDIVYRLNEIQRDLAEIARQRERSGASPAAPTSAPPATSTSAPPTPPPPQ